MRRRLFVLLAAVVSAVAPAQGVDFDGLDLSKPSSPKAQPSTGRRAGLAEVPAPELPPPPADFSEGPPVAVLPPVRAGGRFEVENFRVVYVALQERFDSRLVPAEVTEKAVEVEKLGAKLTTVAAREKLSERLKAPVLIAIELPSGKIEARLFAAPEGPVTAEASAPLGRGKRATQALARALVDELLRKGEASLRVAPPLDLTRAPIVAEGSDGSENVAVEAEGLRPEAVRAPLVAPRAFVLVGVGPGFRSFDAVSNSPVVPQSPLVMASIGVTAAVFPLRLVPSLSAGPLADLWIQGSYRRNLVQATVEAGGTSRTCPVTDDEVVGRVGYRYALGTGLPRIGAGAGVAWERTDFGCEVATLATGYGSTELHLEVLQPILGESLAVEFSGGPRLLFSTRAAGRDTFAFSGELWVTGRPMSYLMVRAGARVTGTKLTTWPDGVALFDVRTFVGVEIGAAL
jgi:hypothetical protein